MDCAIEWDYGRSMNVWLLVYVHWKKYNDSIDNEIIMQQF